MNRKNNQKTDIETDSLFFIKSKVESLKILKSLPTMIFDIRLLTLRLYFINLSFKFLKQLNGFGIDFVKTQPLFGLIKKHKGVWFF